MPKYQVVRINEQTCIGCTKCISVCPVDAIVGASQVNHALLTEYCIGCELCIPPCPVNCIDIIPIETPIDSKQRAQIAKKRIQSRNERLTKDAKLKEEKDNTHITHLQDEIAASLARIGARKHKQWGYDE